jgi:uncharacterized protein
MPPKSEPIIFKSGSLNLEGLLTPGTSSKGVVISHPHPLYGGDRHNYVVGLVAGAFQARGWATLTFNFRGVGRSQGTFDEGRGEQEDVSAALSCLGNHGSETIVLAGYSFGAWVNALRAGQEPKVQSSILVSPPLAMMDFSFLKGDEKTKLIVCGDQDPYCPAAAIEQLARAMTRPPLLEIIPGADHFFSSGSEALISIIRKHETLL